MKAHNLWSYRPYKPLLRDVGDVYICRVAPGENKIHFEWLDAGEPAYSVFYRKRDTGVFLLRGSTEGTEFDIENLDTDCDFEFYVCAGEKKSLIRLARTGKTVGTVVNYLHPDDEAYSFSGRYLCSPSLVRHPDGFLLASMDVYAVEPNPKNLTIIFRSDDDGETWHYVSEVMPSFWGQMFIHKGDLYMISCSTTYGDLLIGKSTDGGKTFCAPVCLLRGSNGKNWNDGVHKNPQNVVCHKGRLYTPLEWGNWKNKEYAHAAMVMSCDENDDLMVTENWTFSEPKKFDPCAPEIAHLPKNTMTLEGTLVLDPEGRLLNVMRFGGEKCAIAYEVDTEDPDAPLRYSHIIPFPANRSKFMIKQDAVSGRYYSVASRIKDGAHKDSRNLLSLMASVDMKDWYVVCDLLDYSHCSASEVGFQYVAFEFEGDDLIYLCRTAINKAHNFHDSNYSTFHRVKNFRDL